MPEKLENDFCIGRKRLLDEKNDPLAKKQCKKILFDIPKAHFRYFKHLGLLLSEDEINLECNDIVIPGNVSQEELLSAVKILCYHTELKSLSIHCEVSDETSELLEKVIILSKKLKVLIIEPDGNGDSKRYEFKYKNILLEYSNSIEYLQILVPKSINLQKLSDLISSKKTLRHVSLWHKFNKSKTIGSDWICFLEKNQNIISFKWNVDGLSRDEIIMACKIISKNTKLEKLNLFFGGPNACLTDEIYGYLFQYNPDERKLKDVKIEMMGKSILSFELKETPIAKSIEKIKFIGPGVLVWDEYIQCAIINQIMSVDHLKELSISQSSLCSSGACAIAQRLKNSRLKNSRLNKLKLENNSFSQSACTHILESISNNKTIKSLSLKNSALCDIYSNECLVHLLEIIKSNTLKKLNMSCKGIRDENNVYYMLVDSGKYCYALQSCLLHFIRGNNFMWNKLMNLNVNWNLRPSKRKRNWLKNVIQRINYGNFISLFKENLHLKSILTIDEEFKTFYENQKDDAKKHITDNTFITWILRHVFPRDLQKIIFSRDCEYHWFFHPNSGKLVYHPDLTIIEKYSI